MKTARFMTLASIIFGLGFSVLAALPARSAETREDRAELFLSRIPANSMGAYGAVARMAKSREVKLSDILGDLDHVNSRRDCADFKAAGFLRMLYLYRDNPEMPPEMRRQVEDALLNFKYWIDEPGKDSMCYWSENHQIIFHSCEYLAGAYFKDKLFSNNGMTGQQHMEKALPMLEQWFGWRERFGFSEWQSNVYYCEDLFALLNLADFAPDPNIRERAAMAVDQIALNMALNSFRGNFTTSHGRSYSRENRSAREEDTQSFMHLLWGLREFSPEMAQADGAAVSLATSSYRLPPALYNLGRDTENTFENYQALGIDLEHAEQLGLSKKEFPNGMFFWGMGMYAHPDTIDLSARMWEQYNLYGNAFFLGLARTGVWLSKRGKLDDFIRRIYDAAEGAFLDNAHIYTYRTPEYILSTALDFHPGRIGAQQTIWQAGLGTDAVVYTTFPGSVIGGSPGYWQGNGSNPRAAQYQNVMVAIYNAPLGTAAGENFRYGFTHAWFPRKAFDEVKTGRGWTFARKGNGYLALYSAGPAFWSGSSELVAPGIRNVWVCELGNAASNGAFENFMNKITSAKIVAGRGKVQYSSPSLGEVSFSWAGPFLVNGREIPLRRKIRYDNPYVRAQRYSERLEITSGANTLILNFKNGERIIR